MKRISVIWAKTAFLTALVATTALATGCANDAQVANSGSTTSESGEGGDEGGTAPVGPDNPNGGQVLAIDAEGWTKLDCVQCGASTYSTDLTITGHFHNQRNSCGQDAWGTLSLEHWNELATAVNAALKTPTGAETCVEVPWDTNWQWGRAMDGTTVVHLDNGTKRELLTTKNRNEVCSNIADRAVAERLRKAMNRLMDVAMRQNASTCVRD